MLKIKAIHTHDNYDLYINGSLLGTLYLHTKRIKCLIQQTNIMLMAIEELIKIRDDKNTEEIFEIPYPNVPTNKLKEYVIVPIIGTTQIGIFSISNIGESTPIGIYNYDSGYSEAWKDKSSELSQVIKVIRNNCSNKAKLQKEWIISLIYTY